MKIRSAVAGLSVLILVCFACQVKQKETSTTTADTLATDTVVTAADIANLVENDSVANDCVRGEPEPVLKKAVYPNEIFQRQPDGTAIESTDLEHNDRLLIYHKGCEYYWLTFRFETSRFQADTTDVPYWMDKAVGFMRDIRKGLDAPIDTDNGTDAIARLLKEKKTAELTEEIVFEEGSIRSAATLDRVQKIDDRRYAIEISFFTGPL
ncbi:hypothetical protein SAMN04488109_3430 [Chryseolinea serpens]|uniref:Lipoprotein n=1 Tax=Chryseolinea serpens TaxID=947013 RepID=A0A1M5RJH9_9BACT|nr:hypothetical protein [Chryseolinea serpens]SHH26394.1 hypothetical protein SAMN04488109_3430 [Chryseolinea serpens]